MPEPSNINNSIFYPLGSTSHDNKWFEIRQLLGFPIAELQIVMREYFIAQKLSWTASVAGTCLKLGINITEYFK